MHFNFVASVLIDLSIFHVKKKKKNVLIKLVGIKGLEMDIGPWAVSKDIKSSEDKQTLTRTYILVGYGRSLIIKD